MPGNYGVSQPMSATAKKNDSGKRMQSLVDSLANALQHASGRDGPVITENQIGQTKSLHVAVIWDDWDGLTPAERSKVIVDAYARAKRLRGLTITLAMGLTAEEALRTGFLPYSIVTMRRAGDPVSLNQLAKAMEDAAGILVKVGASTQLRFPTQESAEDAYRQLSQRIPGPYWAIVHEQPAVD